MDNGWRKLLDALIQAHWQDVCSRTARGISGTEVQFLHEQSAKSFLEGLERSVRDRRDRLARAELPTSYQVIDRDSCRVLAEVRPCQSMLDAIQVPFRPTRIQLVAHESGWRVSGIFHPCFSCNIFYGDEPSHGQTRTSSNRLTEDVLPDESEYEPRYLPGKCFMCRGTGEKYGFGKSEPWRILRPEEMCEYCAGTGDCRECATAETPGWHRVFSLDGLK